MLLSTSWLVLMILEIANMGKILALYFYFLKNEKQ